MPYYINRAVSANGLTRNIQELITDAGMRRRMSKMVRMGVATGMECLNDQYPASCIDAIITSSGFGCLEDSEKFLSCMIENDERLLNPTPFIQSTFNTVGAQIGLLCKNHSYNMTYSHRGCSFETALLDAMLLLEQNDYSNVLIGAIDYNIPAQLDIMRRMGFFRNGEAGEGAFFFILSDKPGDECLGEISSLSFLECSMDMDQLREHLSVSDSEKTHVISNTGAGFGLFPTASAASLFGSLQLLSGREYENIHLYNSFRNEYPSLISVKCI